MMLLFGTCKINVSLKVERRAAGLFVDMRVAVAFEDVIYCDCGEEALWAYCWTEC